MRKPGGVGMRTDTSVGTNGVLPLLCPLIRQFQNSRFSGPTRTMFLDLLLQQFVHVNTVRVRISSKRPYTPSFSLFSIYFQEVYSHPGTRPDTGTVPVQSRLSSFITFWSDRNSQTYVPLEYETGTDFEFTRLSGIPRDMGRMTPSFSVQAKRHRRPSNSLRGSQRVWGLYRFSSSTKGPWSFTISDRDVHYTSTKVFEKSSLSQTVILTSSVYVCLTCIFGTDS